VTNLLKRLFFRHALFLAAVTAVLAGFEFLICAVVSTIDVPGLLAELLNNVPPAVREFVRQSFGGFSAADLLAFGWNHPIALAIGAGAAVVMAARAVSGEVENGALELVLSQPISRRRYFAGQVVFAVSALSLLSAAGAAATLAGQRVYGLRALDGRTLVLLALNYCLLQLAWYGLTLLFSVLGREAGRVAFAGFLVALLSYLVLVIAQLWRNAAFLLPWSVNNYYSPREILAAHALPVRSVAVLAGFAAAGTAAAFWRFLKRDIP